MSSAAPTGANRHYVLAAGGTGGHMLPAFALATELERRGHHVALVTDARGAKIPGKPDFLPAHVIPAGRFGKNPLRWPGGLKALWQGDYAHDAEYWQFPASTSVPTSKYYTDHPGPGVSIRDRSRS